MRPALSFCGWSSPRCPVLGLEDEMRFNYPVIVQFEWAREHPEEAQKEIEKAEGAKEAKAFLGGA